ncbi:creatininase family protein [Bradyrhizobium prioriisuperbiae]|uniref:creatininase family protein n=1 Tax=Bradyrhizobium prioriisuperbiae TaxID=2854389 RepID=UPI0028EFE166|nr:creatininase family protein [Bradyrhizobium prioritasuperba]
MAEINWSRLNAQALRALAAQDAVVLLPVGSTEQHGPHLPTGVDDMLVTAVCRRTAQLLLSDIPVVVAPTVWCGLADHHLSFGGTFSLSLQTYHALLRDLCRSILNAGFRKVVLVNGHAGNIAGLAAISADLTRELNVPIATVTYFMVAPNEIASLLEDQKGLMHACEAETSMMMVVAPELIDMARCSEAQGPSFDVAASLLPTLRRFIPFDEVTSSGVAGDARRSSSLKGEALLGACASALAESLKGGEPWQTAAFPFGAAKR